MHMRSCMCVSQRNNVFRIVCFAPVLLFIVHSKICSFVYIKSSKIGIDRSERKNTQEKTAFKKQSDLDLLYLQFQLYL